MDSVNGSYPLAGVVLNPAPPLSPLDHDKSSAGAPQHRVSCRGGVSGIRGGKGFFIFQGRVHRMRLAFTEKKMLLPAILPEAGGRSALVLNTLMVQSPSRPEPRESILHFLYLPVLGLCN